MATSASAIEAAIISHLEADCDVNLDNEYSTLSCVISAIAKGVYDELQNLTDTAGSPPSPAHQ